VSKKRNIALTDEEVGAIDAFINGFVVPTKRIRARRLLLGNSEQRIEAIQRLRDWLDPAVSVAVFRGLDLGVKFEGLQGRLLDHASLTRMPIDDAEAHANGGFGALFISDNRRVVLLIPEVGQSELCVTSRPETT
jgi:hypothetical protein